MSPPASCAEVKPRRSAKPSRAPQHPRRGRHLDRQDHAHQCPAGRSRQNDRPGRADRRHARTPVQVAEPRGVATKDGVASLSDLVRSSLRLRPDRIPIGEVRGAEALDLLKAWGTGHPGGIGTIHAGTRARRAAPARATHPGGRRHGAAGADRRDHRRDRRSRRPRRGSPARRTCAVEGVEPDGDYASHALQETDHETRSCFIAPW